MNQFVFSGTLAKFETKQSKKGNDYGLATIDAGKDGPLEFPVFNAEFGKLSVAKLGDSVSLKGKITSREYNGRRYPQFNIEEVKLGSEGKPVAKSPETVEDFDLPF